MLGNGRGREFKEGKELTVSFIGNLSLLTSAYEKLVKLDLLLMGEKKVLIVERD